MFSRKLLLALLFVGVAAVGQAFAQEVKQPITKGVFWTDAGTAVDVYLVPKTAQTYRLMVISTKDVKVTYRTSINSVEAVKKELAPVAVSVSVKYFEFNHYFSKMTIWLGLEFAVDGKSTPALTRTFYDSIFQIAPGNMYTGPADERAVTISGCVREGVECLTLEPFNGTEKFSLVSGTKLEIGAAYRITGSIVQVSICQQGKALRPTSVVKLERKCS